GDTPVFVMEMPMYKVPSVRSVLRRMLDAATAFLRRAGTLILASMIVVWALLYFPFTDQHGISYPERIAQLEAKVDQSRQELQGLSRADESADVGARRQELRSSMQSMEQAINQLQADWKGDSCLGRLGRAIAPVVRPLGWDWKIGMAALASFPAREVVVGT